LHWSLTGQKQSFEAAIQCGASHFGFLNSQKYDPMKTGCKIKKTTRNICTTLIYPACPSLKNTRSAARRAMKTAPNSLTTNDLSIKSGSFVKPQTPETWKLRSTAAMRAPE